MALKFPVGGGRFALIDEEDYKLVESAGKWHSYLDGSTFYAKTNKGPKMHRLIMGFPKGKCIDHINGNGLDNRKCNLRVCTIAENCRNTKTRTDNKSGFRGVYLHKRDKKWMAAIKTNGKRKHLGCFNSPIEAAKAYNEAAVRLHGEFATLNNV